MAPKAKGDGTEDRLRKLISDTVGEILDGRDKQQRSSSETKEQQWLRQAMREEVSGFFDDFLKGMDEGKKKEEPGEEPEDEGGSIVKALFGGR